jgi:5-methylcytosine-specific restriction enzyme A
VKLYSGTTARAVEEWVGATPDTKIPDRVRIRVFERYGGKCYITGNRLSAGEWDIEHVKSLKAGGENRENNLAPAWRKPHKEKTATENIENAKINRKKRKHLLPKVKKHKWQSRSFSQERFDNTKQLREL